MKKIIVLLLSVIPFCPAKSQVTYLTFTASGAVSIIDSVQVLNLDQGTRLTVSGTDSLMLLPNIGIAPNENTAGNIKIYPNPASSSSNLEFYISQAGTAIFEVYAMHGIQVFRQEEFLLSGRYQYALNGLKQGAYIVMVKSPGEIYSGRLIISISENKAVSLIRNSYEYGQTPSAVLKSKASPIQMHYLPGEHLLLRSYTGLHIHIKSIVPVGNEVVNFEFSPCVDGDDNHYPVVTIGSQVWMAEYLKTSSFSDGSPITLITDNSTWVDYTLPAYCWFNNDEITYKQSMGGIYNWYAASSNNVCPAGWHVPSDEEWKTLEGSVDSQFGVGHSEWNGGSWRGFDAGCNLRAKGIWTLQIPGCETDYFGFSAIPTGSRSYISGSFGAGTNWNYIWASDDIDQLNGIARHLHSSYHGVRRTNQAKGEGASIRCLKNFNGK